MAKGRFHYSGDRMQHVQQALTSTQVCAPGLLLKRRFNMKTTIPVVGMILAMLFLTGCGSITIVVGEEGPGSTILKYDGFRACPGATFKITITQNGKSITSPEPGTVAGETLKFSGLKDVDTSQILEVSVEIVGDDGCGKFEARKSYSTGPIVLPPARDPQGQPIKDTFVLGVNKFH